MAELPFQVKESNLKKKKKRNYSQAEKVGLVVSRVSGVGLKEVLRYESIK